MERQTRGLSAACTLLVCLLAAPDGMAVERRAQQHATYLRELTEIDQSRRLLFQRLKNARTSTEKSGVRDEARRLVVDAIVNTIVPAWQGMPWTMAVIPDGLKPDATYPFEKGKGISCSWFVVSVLRNAGLTFVNPRQFAGAISIHIQYALSPDKETIHRFFHVTPAQLERKLKMLGDGLYVIGLNCHVGFIYVDGDRVDILHSSYTSPQEVAVEPVTASEAIANSERAGYVVSALFRDIRLIDHWLSGQRVPFVKYPKGRK